MIIPYSKHLWKTAKTKPLQPLILVVSIALAVAVFVSSLLFESILLQKMEIERVASFKNSDIRISISSGTEKKYFERSDILDFFDEDDIIECNMSYAMSYKGLGDKKILAPVLGVDFAHINKINKIDFIESKTITNQNRNDVAIIGEDFAKENGLHVDDEIDLSIFGVSQRFVVIGIAHNSGYFLKHDIITSIENLMQIIMIKAPILILNSNLKIYNTAIIKLANPSTKAEKIEKLKNSKVFGDKQIEDSLSIGKDKVDSSIITTNLFISLLILCSSIVSIILMYTAYEIFMGNRLHSVALFKSVGATNKQTIGLLLSEVFIYSLIGTISGLALSLLLSRGIVNLLGGFLLGVVFPKKTFLYGAMYGCSLPLICVLIPIINSSKMDLVEMLSGSTKRFKEPKSKVAISLLFTLVLQIVILLLLPYKYRFYCTIIIIITTILTVIFTLPYVTAFFSKIICNLYDKKTKKNILNISLKNSKRNLSIQNANRIFCVASIIIVVLLNSLSHVKKITWEQAEALNFDYQVTSLLFPSDLLHEDIIQMEGVESAHIVSIGSKATLENKTAYPLILYEGEIKDIFTKIDYIGEASEIKAGEVVISRALALTNNYTVGDKVKITANNISASLKIIAILETNSFYIVASAENYDLKYDQILINEKKDSNIYEELIAKMEEKLAVVNSRGSSVDFVVKIMDSYIRPVEIFTFTIISITLLGVINSVIISLKSRKKDFSTLQSLGMKKSEIILMVAMEFAINLIGITITILLATLVLNFSIMQAIKYFGINYKTILFN